MDFSKASLEKNFIPETFYVDDSSNNQKNNDHQRHKPDKGEEDGKDLTNKKYNQLHPHFLVNQHDIKPALNTDNSVQENDLVILGKRCDDKSNQLKTPKTGHPTTELQKTLASCSNFYEKKIIKNQLSDNARLTDDDLINKNTEKLMVNKNGHCQIEVEDEEETIEKIAEMIETSSKGTENSTKGKKRLQELMRRSYSEQQNASSVNIDTKVHSLPEDVKDICYKKKKYDNINIFPESREVKIPDKSFTSDEKKEETEKKTKKSRFEEIEDKLEEMFAGIEDEKLENVVTDNKDMSKRISEDSVVNYIDVNCNDTSKENYINVFVDDSLKYDNSVLLPTKAAKKSTSSILIKEKISPILNQNNQTITNSAVEYLKTMHRRDSINMEISNDNVNEVICNKNSLLIKDKLVTPQPLNSESNKVTKKRTKYVRKSKIKNNRNKCSEFKKDTSKKIIKNRNYKKNSAKSDVINKSTIQQKIKQNLSSENENDERLLPAKDCETKHRSPFILVKNNGSIAVINTIATDDSNEKWSRTKKTSNYVYERKTVKGCHSSTLSNRYDADTADSSWICVLCKIGPHQKRLGDLFGPYVITSDCDEYRSVTEFIEKIQTSHRADTALHNFSNKSVKHIDDKSNSDIQQICRFNEDTSALNFTLGMSRISDVCYEIWIHEECAIWAPNLFVVGSRLAGLEDVTWSSMRYECVYCLKPGALLCCLQRDCKATSHVPCAREFNWSLDESKFWAYCNTHILK